MDVRKAVVYSFSVRDTSIDPMGHLRISAPYQQAGIRLISGIENDQIYTDRVSEGDIVVVQREFPLKYEAYQKIIASARREGKPLVLDLDDLLLFLPENHPDRLGRYYAASLLPMFQTLMEADLVTVSTPCLRDVLADYNQNVVVLPNYFDDNLWRLTPPLLKDSSHEVLTIGYMATKSHQPDLDYVTPVLLDLINRYPQKIRFHFWGLQPPAELLALTQVEWTPPQAYSYRDFATFFQDQSVDIFIAPLTDNLFNRCKSPLKFFEYSALGAPGVYSGFGSYSDVVTHGRDGLLATSLEEWGECLIQLIENDELRFQLATNAQASIRQNWLLSRNAFRWREAFQNLPGVSLHQPRNEESLLQSINSQLVEMHEQKDAEIQNLIGRVAEQDKIVQALTEQVAEKVHRLSVIYRSKAWRVAMVLRRMRIFLLPPGGLRTRIASKLLSSFLFPFELRKRYQISRDLALIRNSGLFDRDWYLTNYPDIARTEMEPARHYLLHGGFEGRDPGPGFSSSWYLEHYRDVKGAKSNPLVHYLRFGAQEGRIPKAPARDVPAQVAKGQEMKKGAQTSPLEQAADKRARGLRSHIYRIGKRVYWSIPRKFRQKILSWSYQNLGFLLRGVPHYENWRINRAYVQDKIFYHHQLIDIHEIEPAEVAEGKIAIHLHIFYPDLVKEFVAYLKNMPFPYDLYVSVHTDETLRICKQEFTDLPFCRHVEIKRVANRGRDIAPMFCAFGMELAGYDYIAHLHTKKSLYNKGATAGWREYLGNGLLGSEDRIRRIFGLMQGEQPYGIVYPQNYARLPYWANTWLANKQLGQLWCARMGIGDIPRGYFDFPLGTMFWARGDALTPLFKAGITIVDFPEETGQADGTLAHTLERLLVLSSLKQGMPPGILMDEEQLSWSAWRFDHYVNRPYSSMVQLLNSPDIKLIAFDIFDTLFCRPLLDPETIKRIVARRVGGEAGMAYREYRALAEQQARQANGQDVGLDQIYAFLGKLTGLADDELARLRHIEEEVEAASVEPRREAIQLFKDAIATGKPVTLITDMFLPRKQIETYLRKYGLTGWDALFVSNEIGLRKDSGKLYHHVLAHYGIEPREMLVIGDDERSDAQIPIDMGANFIHLLKPLELARGLPRFANIIAHHESKRDIDDEITLGLVVRKNFSPIQLQGFDPDSLVQATPYQLGYSLVGPLLTSFSQWLSWRAQQDGVNRLYFLAREGKLIKAVYDCWSKGVENAPMSDYLVLSRRAAGVATISGLDDILDIARTTYYPNTIEKFLHTRYGISLSDDHWRVLADSLGMDRTTNISVQDRQIEHLVPLLETLEAIIKARAQNEQLALHAYLMSKGLNQDDHQAVVDVGYGGTVQDYINRLLSQKVHGYYLMTEDRSSKVAEAHNVLIMGCFFENIKPSSNAPIMQKYSFELEKLLSSNDPQIEYYELDASGEVKGHHRELSLAETGGARIRSELQSGIMDYTKDARRVRATMLPDFRPSCWTAQMLMDTFLIRHSRYEADLLADIALDDYYCGRDIVT